MPKKRKNADQQLKTDAPRQEIQAVPQAARSRKAYYTSLRPASYIPSMFLQILSATYCLVALPGQRPSSLTDVASFLKPLEEATVPSLWKVLFGLAVSQLYFGGQAKRWWDASLGDKQEKLEETQKTKTSIKSGQVAAEALGRKIDPLVETCSLTIIAALGIFAIAMLLGAMVTKKQMQTLQLSAFIALLAVTPPAYAISSPFVKTPLQTATRYNWIRLFTWFDLQSDVEIVLMMPSYGALLGGLFSAPALALDWEEPWQLWPLPCIVGSFTGWVLGHLFALAVCSVLWLGKRRPSYRPSHMGPSEISKDK